MTWGTHCPQCGREDCGWVKGEVCEGSQKAEIARLRADKAELLAALRSAEESIVAFIAMDGDSDAGLILKQVRDTIAKVSK